VSSDVLVASIAHVFLSEYTRINQVNSWAVLTFLSKMPPIYCANVGAGPAGFPQSDLPRAVTKVLTHIDWHAICKLWSWLFSTSACQLPRIPWMAAMKGGLFHCEGVR
jgi:hypothetical protein